MSVAALQLPEVGEVVGEGRFELQRQLGEGGVGTVFVAADRLLGCEVALKLLIPRYVGRPDREQRLVNEAEYLRRMQGHPNVLQFVDSGRLRDRIGWPWLSTEILVGEDLDWLFIRGTVEIPQVISIARQTAVALAACHEAGVVHRDLTPSNLFLLEDKQTIKLFDFSHAGDLHAPKLVAGAPDRLTKVMDIPGTVGYMGPEQVMNAPPDPCMDVYAFGILLYKLVTKREPYQQWKDVHAFIKAQREGALEQPRLHAWAYDAPQELADLVRDCTERDGTKRPTVNEIIARLDAIGKSPVEAAATDAIAEVTEAVDAVALHRAQPTAAEPEVTAPVDARALMQPRRPKSRTVQDGDWTVANRSWGPAPALAAPAPIAVPTAPTEEKERTVELAFARPPQLREADASTAAPVSGWEPVLAGPPELRQVDSEGSEELDPENFSATDASIESDTSAEEDPGPIGRMRIVGLVVGLGLLVTILALLASSKLLGPQSDREKEIDGDRDQAATSPHYPDEATESDGGPSVGETDADDSDTVAETGGMEVVPQVEPIETEPPKPKNGKPANGKPAKDPTCEGVEADAQTAFKARDWRQVVKLTARKACWTSNENRVLLRVEALFSLGDWAGCVNAGTASKNAQVRSLVEQCQAAAAVLKNQGSP